MLQKIQVWMTLKMNILYHMHHIKPILLFWFLAQVDLNITWCNKHQNKNVSRELGSGKCIRISGKQGRYPFKDQAMKETNDL